MAVKVIKAEKVVRLLLGLLERETILPRLVWRNAGGDFAGAKDETITLVVPSYAVARTRALRSGAPRIKDGLNERSVKVTLTTDIYKRIGITDEELTLDIVDFTNQVINPNLAAIVRGLEDAVADEIATAPYHANYTLDIDTAKPEDTVVDARNLLNKARVPMSERVLAVGADVESLILKSPNFKEADKAGDNSALRDAVLGRIRGFTAVSVPSLPPEDMVAYHRSAFALAERAPVVPRGAPWGASMSWEGFAIRVVQALDPDTVEDQVHFDVFAGTNHVKDVGHFDTAGTWHPAVDPDGAGEDEHLVRAVRMTIAS